MFLTWTWYTCNASGIRFRFFKHSTHVHSTTWVATEHVVYIQMSHYRNVYQHASSSQQAHEHEEHMLLPDCTWKWTLIGSDYSGSSSVHPSASHFIVHNITAVDRTNRLFTSYRRRKARKRVETIVLCFWWFILRYQQNLNFIHPVVIINNHKMEDRKTHIKVFIIHK